MNTRFAHGIRYALLLSVVVTAACRDPNSAAARQDFRTAILEDQTETVRRWLDQGLDPNEQASQACSTPLTLAVMRGNSEIIGLILEHGPTSTRRPAREGRPCCTAWPATSRTRLR